jgi:MoaA/NifB/PqqE/SkfB family radical SAM enzyme
MISSEGPDTIIWDITYACPLRCVHCYSESGRRAARQLRHEDMLRVLDAMISLKPKAIILTGGEPLLVKGVYEIAERVRNAGIRASLYTGAWTFSPAMVDPVMSVFSQVSVSLDGATAEIHDLVRGRAGSFDRVMNALTLLDSGKKSHECRLGIDFVAVRSNLHQLAELCTTIAGRFPRLDGLAIGTAMPAGLAGRKSVEEHELLTDEQVARLESPEQLQALREIAPKSVHVVISGHEALMLRPDLVAKGIGYNAMQVEPDGGVRGMAIYEGVVGNLLTDPPGDLWQRAVERVNDPFVVETLATATTMRSWADAARRIDYHFGTDDDRARIDRRPELIRP